MIDESKLIELKRSVFVTISITSVGELKLRLNEGKGPISSEILGQIIGEDYVKSHARFVA